jgi:hypothetical protein
MTHQNWRDRELERQGIGETGSWRDRELERQGVGETGSWRDRELERQGVGETGRATGPAARDYRFREPWLERESGCLETR